MEKLNQKTILLVIVLLFIIIFVAYRLTSQKNSQDSHKLQVVASIYPLYFFASEIGGDKAEVQNITPAGAEPHEFEPTALDIARIEKSKLLILNGSNLEPWGDKIKTDLRGTSVTVVVAGESLANNFDPHFWLSPPLAKKQVEAIARAFLKVDPKNKNYYLANAARLAAQLDNLHADFQQGLARCQKTDIITSHAAFGHLASAYGLTQLPIAGLSPDEEPSSKQLVEIVDFAKKHDVRYVFFEKLISPKLACTIAQEIGAQTLVLDPLEGISQKDMQNKKNYFTIMEENLSNLRLALQCQ